MLYPFRKKKKINADLSLITPSFSQKVENQKCSALQGEKEIAPGVPESHLATSIKSKMCSPQEFHP